MPTGVVTVSEYVPQPAIQVDPASSFDVRGWYSASFIGGDAVTPILGNSTNGEEGPYIDIPSSLNASGYLVVPEHDVQATTLSNPTANYFEGLWIDGAFNRLLMPNNNVTSGWQIPTIYGSIIAIDEIALYNRAKRLLFPPDTYPTFEEVVLLIQRLAGNFDYMAVGVNGIGQASFPPVVASVPIVLMENDPRVGSWFNIKAYFAATTNTAAQNTVFVQAAIAAAAAAGGGIYWPAGYFPINTISINVPVLFAPGRSGPRPASGQTVTFTGTITADSSKHFDTVLGGTISFANSPIPPVLDPNWWETNTIPGGTDMTAAIQAAIIATGGRGKVLIPQSTYKITDTLTDFPDLGGGYSMVILEGEGAYSSNLVNAAPANTPTVIINIGGVQIRNLGFWSQSLSFPNDGIHVDFVGGTFGNRTYIKNNSFYTNGYGIQLHECQSVYILENYGPLSGGGSTLPPGVTGGFSSTAPAFIHADVESSNPNVIVIENNISEGFTYAVDAELTAAFGDTWRISGNNFEGSINGIRLVNILGLTIADNYLGEGGTGYTIDLTNCRGGTIGPNHIHFAGFDAFPSTVKLTSCSSLQLLGAIPRLYLAGTTLATTGVAVNVDRIQDESTDHLLTLAGSTGSIGAPKSSFNIETGLATWYSDFTARTLYPTVRLADVMYKVTPDAFASPGWIATTAASSGTTPITLISLAATCQVTTSAPHGLQSGQSVIINGATGELGTAVNGRQVVTVTGATTFTIPVNTVGLNVYIGTGATVSKLTRTTGSGPAPLVLPDYSDSTAYDLRITITTGGATGTAKYRLASKPQGSGSYADITSDLDTTELAHVIQASNAPVFSIAVAWPTSAGSYVLGNQWELLNVVAPVWTPMASPQVLSSPSLTPSAVNANTTAEQDFIVAGLTTADYVIVNGPAPTAGTGIVGARVKSTNVLSIAFMNDTAAPATPTAGVYNVVAVRL